MTSDAPISGSSFSFLEKSFKRCVRSLLTACPAEDFSKAFPTFTASEQQRLRQLFIQVITSLHQDIEEDFEAILLDAQVGKCLDTVEELVEEHNLDQELLPEKSNVEEAAQSCLEAKENELSNLTRLLAKAEEKKKWIRERVELLKKEKQEFSGAVNLVHELRTQTLNHESHHRAQDYES